MCSPARPLSAAESVDSCSVEGASRLTLSHRAARRQMCVRADVRAESDLCIAPDRVLDHAICFDDAVDEPYVGADLTARADDSATLQDGARVEGDIAAQLDRDIDERLPRIEHG